MTAFTAYLKTKLLLKTRSPITTFFELVSPALFVGILVRGNYDDLEASFFEAQDDSLEVRKCLSSGQPVP